MKSLKTTGLIFLFIVEVLPLGQCRPPHPLLCHCIPRTVVVQ